MTSAPEYEAGRRFAGILVKRYPFPAMTSELESCLPLPELGRGHLVSLPCSDRTAWAFCFQHKGFFEEPDKNGNRLAWTEVRLEFMEDEEAAVKDAE